MDSLFQLSAGWLAGWLDNGLEGEGEKTVTERVQFQMDMEITDKC